MSLTPGSRFGAYEIVGPIGAGGMGEVYRAHDTKLGRDVALKVLPPSALGDSKARERLVREARLAASLNHPAICTVHDVDEANGLIYVAMELVHGDRLADLIPTDGFALDVVLRIGLQIAEAFAHAHEHGIVHRDLKGANVLVLKDGRTKVLDFGLAARHGFELDEATRTAASLESPGVVAGTLPYMAPEALRGAAADPRSDVWSLGVLLYEMATGRRPFGGTSSVDLTSAILRDPVPPDDRMPAGLWSVIEHCLEKEASRRYRNGAEVQAALAAVAAGEGTASVVRLKPDAPYFTSKAVTRSRAGRPAAGPLLAAAVGLLGLLAVAVFVWPGFRFNPPRTSSSDTIKALAVLPLENLSGDPAQEYFADGITEELITRLSKVSGLAVTARTSVMPFKKSGQSVERIAGQLGVQAIVEGSVAREGDRVRITARLHDVAAGKSLWAERYDRAASDVFALQGDVASAIGHAIRSNITQQERRSLTSAMSRDPAAYDAYLRGRVHAGRENPDDIRKTIEFFERAVAADPQFAAAHAELARAYGQHLFYVAPGDTAVQERAFVEIERALAIDPDLDTAHLARGLLLWQSWNHFPHDRAIASYRRAIELNPNSDEAHHQLGIVYLHVGLLDEAEREVREALRLNPSNTLAQFRLGVLALYRAQYAEAAQIFDGTPANFQPPLRAFQKADALFHLGRKDEARATSAAYLTAHPEDLGGMNTAVLALVAADAGETARLPKLVATSQEHGKGYGHFHHTAFTLARAYALAGNATEAVRWLQQTADDGYPCFPVFENDRTLDRIRGDAAFKTFLEAQRRVWESFKRLAQ